jgi:hypothetical protein
MDVSDHFPVVVDLRLPLNGRLAAIPGDSN